MDSPSILSRYRREIAISVLLVLSSCVLYGLQLVMFQSPRDTFFYILQDLSFVPIQVVLVTIVFSQLLNAHERRSTQKKVHTIMGIFFGEMGKDFLRLCQSLGQGSLDGAALAEVEIFLRDKRQLRLALLENPNLMEHDQFTDMLWAVSHLSDELSARQDLSKLSQADAAHLAGDLKRAYEQMAELWRGYMAFLKTEYPYLHSYAARTDPFDSEAKVEVG